MCLVVGLLHFYAGLLQLTQEAKHTDFSEHILMKLTSRSQKRVRLWFSKYLLQDIPYYVGKPVQKLSPLTHSALQIESQYFFSFFFLFS